MRLIVLALVVAGALPAAPARAEEAASPASGATGAPAMGAARSSLVQPALLVLRGAGPDERPRALESLMAAVARRSSVAPDTGPVPRLRPQDPALFDHPLVFTTGSQRIERLDEAETDALRAYLTSGGMLVVDDHAQGTGSPFGASVREELSRVLGGRKAETLRHDHALYRSFYLLDRAWGRVDLTPELSAFMLDRRVAVLECDDDMLGAWERDEMGEWAHDVTPGGTQQREMAIRLGVNVVLYALTLDYKEDLVHLPLILERKR